MGIRLTGIFATVTFFIIHMVSPASAATIGVEVIDTTSIGVTFSGNLSGPVPPSALGNLMIDIPELVSNNSTTNITGALNVGDDVITNVHVGYNNSPWGATIQFRSGANGENGFSVGDLLSGSAIITFLSAHQLTQSMFDDAAIYWRGLTGSNDTFQGNTYSAVPLPTSALLLLTALGASGLFRKRKSLRASFA